MKKHYTNTDNPIDFPGADIHAGDGGYSIGNREDYEKFVKVRNQSLAEAREREISEIAKQKERIRELAGQALDRSVPQTWTTLTPYELDKFMRVFAELLVQDCANYVREAYDHPDAEGIAWNMEIKFGLHGDYA